MSQPANETTPLIAVVHVAPAQPPRRRNYNHSGVRRFCSCCLGLLLLVSITAALLVLFLVPDCDRNHQRHRRICIPKHPLYRDHNRHSSNGLSTFQADPSLDYAHLIDVLLQTPNETKVKEWSKYYTSGPHLAGKNLSQAEWTKDRWIEFGVPQTEIVAYDIYANYPIGHRLALLKEDKNKSSSSGTKSWSIKYEASLKEDVLKEDETSGLDERIPTFHGYSASGNVTASYVFVNYGTYQDFEDLVNANVSLVGKIALIKYGGIFRGLKVKRAQELGMVGAVIYSDPGDDGDLTLENGNETYPKGPARNPSSVQRGSVQYLCKLHIQRPRLNVLTGLSNSSRRSHHSWISIEAWLSSS
jgi:N-acetylated-alpha-linked acidic dipeptidase